MAKKKIEFPAECCGVCKFAHNDDSNQLFCFAKPPTYIPQIDGTNPRFREADVEPTDFICYFFKPKEHS